VRRNLSVPGRALPSLRPGHASRRAALEANLARGRGRRLALCRICRLVPLFPFNLLNYALGLTRIRLTVYVLASAVCMTPGAFAYTWLGYAGRQAVVGGAETVRDVAIAIGLIAATALVLCMVRRFREKPSFIRSSELNERLKRTPEPFVIDVRTQEEFARPLEHVSGARNKWRVGAEKRIPWKAGCRYPRRRR
jgi:hypothetical protein